jgi:hypothetical protein
VEQSGAGARKADDEKGLPYFFPRNFRKRIPITLEEEPIAELLSEIGAHGKLSNEIETGLAMTGIEQTRKSLEEVALAKIFQRAATFRSFHESVATAAANDGAIKENAAAVERADGERDLELCDGR